MKQSSESSTHVVCAGLTLCELPSKQISRWEYFATETFAKLANTLHRLPLRLIQQNHHVLRRSSRSVCLPQSSEREKSLHNFAACSAPIGSWPLKTSYSRRIWVRGCLVLGERSEAWYRMTSNRLHYMLPRSSKVTSCQHIFSKLALKCFRELNRFKPIYPVSIHQM